MPEMNVEIARRVLDAFAKRDIDVFLEYMDSDVSFFAPTAVYAGRGNQLYRGHDGVRAYLQDVERTWEEIEINPREYLEGNDGCVAVIGSAAGRLKSGDSIDSPAGWGFKVRDGRIVWCRVYTNPNDALVDVGLANHTSDQR
jgi:ketosteroid isomerase-like protein